jgi:hypothetical protein
MYDRYMCHYLGKENFEQCAVIRDKRIILDDQLKKIEDEIRRFYDRN